MKHVWRRPLGIEDASEGFLLFDEATGDWLDSDDVLESDLADNKHINHLKHLCYTVVRSHKLGEVENEWNIHNFSFFNSSTYMRHNLL